MPVKDGQVIYDEVVDITGLKKEELYGKAKLWFVETFKSTKDVIQLDDKENGILIGKGIKDLGDKQVNFTIKIQIKDGKYKAEINQLVYKYNVNGVSGETPAEKLNSPNAYNKKGELKALGWKVPIQSIDETSTSVLKSLKQKMTSTKKDDF